MVRLGSTKCGAIVTRTSTLVKPGNRQYLLEVRSRTVSQYLSIISVHVIMEDQIETKGVYTMQKSLNSSNERVAAVFCRTGMTTDNEAKTQIDKENTQGTTRVITSRKPRRKWFRIWLRK